MFYGKGDRVILPGVGPYRGYTGTILSVNHSPFAGWNKYAVKLDYNGQIVYTGLVSKLPRKFRKMK